MASPAPQGRPWPRYGHRQAQRRRRPRRGLRTPDLALMLTVIPSLPRSTLSRLTTAMIDRMDEIDGDPDLEDLGDDDEDSHDREGCYD